MSVNILKTWTICCFLVTVTEQKLKAVNFRSLPLRTDKLTIAELPSYNLFEPYGPGTYAFGYEIEDTASNNVQFRDEEKLQNGTVRGSYGLVRPNGLVSITRYIADESGYHSTTQTFNQNDKKPTLLTSTESPFLQMSSPSDVNYLDVPNPVTISPAVAQQILDQHKIDLITESSNIPITEIFSADDDNSSDTDDGIEKSKQPTQELSSTTVQHLLTESQNIIVKPGKNQTTNEKKVIFKPETNLKPIVSNTFIQKPPNKFKPHVPIPESVTQIYKQPTTANLSDDSSNKKPSQSSTPFGSFPQLPNIFENILPHIPQLPFPTNMMTSTTEPSNPSSDSLSDESENETSSVSTIITKPPDISPQLPNIFENILPHIPQLPIPSNMKPTTQATSTTTGNSLSDESETSSISTTVTKPPDISPQLPNIFENILPHIPQLPIPSNMKPTTQATPTTTGNSLSDKSETSSISTTVTKPPEVSPQLPNIFESILPHIPQLPQFPSNTQTSTKAPSTAPSNNLSDETGSETSSVATATITKPSETYPQFPNIFENILPHIPQLPSNMKTTTQSPSTTALNSLADDNENETTTKKPEFGISSLPPIFGFLNPENFPIFKPPSNFLPNKQENTENPNTNAMDSFFDSTTPVMEPIFAIIHKNATFAPIFDDDGNHIGVQLIHNLIPSNFHIIPFIIPNNYFQSSPTTDFPQNQNIAHDDVLFEDGAPLFVNDKFHDPLNDVDPAWKRKSFRRRKGVKKIKKRRNSNLRRRNRCSI